MVDACVGWDAGIRAVLGEMLAASVGMTGEGECRVLGRGVRQQP